MASPALLDDGLSSQCLLETPQLSCRRQAGSDNTSRLVCASSDGQERATDMYAVLASLSVLVVPLAVLLNLAVVVTVYLNRRLHTVINVLVTVLCMNNVMWTGMPILCVFAVNFPAPWHCTLRYFLYLSTRHICFSVIVIITVLRYLLVVKNRAFPADQKNTLIFIAFAVMPSLIKFYFRSARDHAKCRQPLAWSPDGYAIYGLIRDPVDWISVTVVSTEYISGLLVIAFCYGSILTKIVRSKRRLRARGNRLAQASQPKPAKLTVTEQPQPETSHERNSDPEDSNQGRGASLSEFVRAIRLRSAGESAEALPLQAGQSQPSRSSGRLAAARDASSAQKYRRQAKQLTTIAEVEPDEPSRSNAVIMHLKPQPQPPSDSPRLDTDNVSAASTSSTSRMKPSHSRQERTSTSRDGDINHIASNNLILQPSNLLRVGPFRPTSGEQTSSASAVTPRAKQRRPGKQHAARVDIVATVSVTAFILIFFVVISPLWTLQLVNDSAECVILPTMRIFLYIILIVTGSVAAIASPFVLVLFSGDFRQALRDTFRRLTQ